VGSAESEIKEIAGRLRQAFDRIEKHPSAVTSAQCEELRREVSLIDYYYRYGWRTPRSRHGPTRVPYRQCACGEATTLYIIADTAYCLEHVPRTLTFPIGMHGEDFAKWQSRT